MMRTTPCSCLIESQIHLLTFRQLWKYIMSSECKPNDQYGMFYLPMFQEAIPNMPTVILKLLVDFHTKDETIWSQTVLEVVSAYHHRKLKNNGIYCCGSPRPCVLCATYGCSCTFRDIGKRNAITLQQIIDYNTRLGSYRDRDYEISPEDDFHQTYKSSQSCTENPGNAFFVPTWFMV